MFAHCNAGSSCSCPICHVLCARLRRRCGLADAKPRDCSGHYERDTTPCRAAVTSGKRPTSQLFFVLHYSVYHHP